MGRMLFFDEGKLGIIVISNPTKRNAISFEMWKELGEILDQIKDNREMQAIIISGEGNHFSSGADISQFSQLRTGSNREDYDQAIYSAGSKLKKLLIPTIADIKGQCLGGGFALALKCDFRIAAENVTFSLPAVKRGIGYPLLSIKDLVEVVGLSNAKEILITGRKINFEESKNLGLITNVNSYIKNPLEYYVKMILENAPLSIRAVKTGFLTLFNEHQEGPSLEEYINICFDSEDYKEATAAFNEKRKAIFKGK